ncbi:MAG: glycosyltransferase family 4 protein [Anaerolineae bacterium]|nr:glycosyltransferase family 4 protein [Anaerolineae bacterium]
MTTSTRLQRLARLADMLGTTWRHRNQYVVAQVDVYSGPAFLWAEAVCWMLRRINKPYVLTLHGGQLPNFARHWPKRVRHLLQSAAIVTTPSRYLAEQMQPYRSDLHLLPNPLDLSAYAHTVRTRPQPRLIWLRAFCEIYNPSLAPRVLAILSQDFPDSSLIMIGPDKGDGSLQFTQQVAEELGVTDRLELPGGVPKAKVPLWLNKGDIFINTTNIDNTPVSVLEAMACGLCVVSTDVGGLPYLLEQEQDTLLVPPDDPEAMAAAVRRLLTEQQLAERLSRQARQKTEQFDWSVLLSRWDTLLRAAAKNN